MQAYWSPILEIEWQVRADRALLPGIRLVDTMGLNQKLASSTHLHHLQWQYERADAVLWLVSVDKINSQETRRQMEEASRYKKLMYVLVNRWDQCSNKAEALRRCETFYGHLATAIVPVSALAALLSRMPKDQKLTDSGSLGMKRKHPDVETLREVSNFESLKRHFSDFLDERRAYAQNLQRRSALARKVEEFRQMASTVHADAEANLRLYTEVEIRIESARETSAATLERVFADTEVRMVSRLEEAIGAVDYDTRHQIKGLLGLDKLRNDTLIVERREATGATRRYADVLTWIARRSGAYVESSFSATGSVAERIVTACTTRTDVEVSAKDVMWRLPDTENLIQSAAVKLGIQMSEVPILGALVELFFGSAIRASKREATNVLRETIREELPPQVREYVRSVRDGLQESVARVGSDLLDDAGAQFAESGGRAAHERTIARVDEVMGRTILEPILVKAPLDAMRRRGWGRGGAALR